MQENTCTCWTPHRIPLGSLNCFLPDPLDGSRGPIHSRMEREGDRREVRDWGSNLCSLLAELPDGKGFNSTGRRLTPVPTVRRLSTP